MATPRSFYDGFTGSPKGAALGEALAVSPSLSSARTACTLKGGCLSITTQGSYWLSSPHPLALSTTSRPGIPAMAETRSRVGARVRRAERGAKARGKRLARTLPGNSSAAVAWAWRRAKEWLQTLEISQSLELLAIATPTLHLMQPRVGNIALLSHRTIAA